MFVMCKHFAEFDIHLILMGLFSVGVFVACRTLQRKRMTVHKNTFVIWDRLNCYHLLLKQTLCIFLSRSDWIQISFKSEASQWDLCPGSVYSLRGDITCSCLQLAQLFPVAVLKFYSPP